MKIENKIIDILGENQLSKDEIVSIKYSIIKTIDFTGLDFDFEIIIENCIIENFLINSSWFKKGLKFKNNHIFNYIDYQMGGHNLLPIIIDGCIFYDFFNFFDCQFSSDIILVNNIFIKGSNLLGNENEGYENSFIIEPYLKNNIGDLNLDGIGK